MSRLAKWFRKFSPADPARGRRLPRRDRVRLAVEGLEERSLPTVVVFPIYGDTQSHGNGAALSSQNVELIFWGPSSGPYAWTNAQMYQYHTAASNLIASGYLNGVTQYGSDAKVSLVGDLADTNPLPGSVSQDDVEDQKDLLFQQNKLPTQPTMFVFVTPAGYPQSFGANVAGENWVDGGIPLIWVGANNYSNGTPNLDNFTLFLGHEMAEELSSPDGNGFMVNPGSPAANPLNAGTPGQIGDYEPNQLGYTFRTSTGVLVQPYWSQHDSAFIIGDSTSLEQFFITPNRNSSGGFNGTYSLLVMGDQLTTTKNDQFDIAVNANNQIIVTANGETIGFDQNKLTQITIASGTGNDTLVLDGLPAYTSLYAGAGGNLTIRYTGAATVQGKVNATVSGKLTVQDPNGAYQSYTVTSGSVTVDSNSALQYSLSSLGSLEVDGGLNCSFTVQSTPFGNEPLTIATTDVNNTVTLMGLSEPVTISTLGGDITSASMQAGGQWTLNNIADPYGVDITINGNTVQYHNYVALTLVGLQGLTVNGSPGNTHFTVQATGTAEPLTLNTGTGTNTVDVAGAASAVTINAHGTDTVNIGSAQKLDGIAPVTVHGNGNTVLTLNDQASNSVVGFGLTTGRVERDVHAGTTTITTLFNYDNVKTLTLNGSNNGSDSIDIESLAIPSYVNGGTATSSIAVDYTLKNLDNIGAYLSITGASSPLSVYDQADAHAASGTPIAYTVGNEEVTRDATINGSKVSTRIDAVTVKSVTLYTSQTSGSSPNTVSAASATPAPVTLTSGAADTITVTALAGPLTLDAHGGTVATATDAGLQNSSGGDTTDTYTMTYTVTDHTVVRNELLHEVEVIAPGSDPSNPADPGSGNPNGGVVIRNYTYNGTLNYQNVKSLALLGGLVNSTFAVQSTPVGMPVTINGYSGLGTSNQFIVGFNGSVKNIHSQLTLSGSANDTLLVDDSLATLQDKVTVTNGNANHVHLGMASTDQFFGSGGGLDALNIGALTVNLSKATGDTVSLTPNAVTAFFINGNGTGADLELNLGGLSFQETQTGPNSGKFTFGSSAKAVTFQNIATVHTH